VDRSDPFDSKAGCANRLEQKRFILESRSQIKQTITGLIS